VVTLRRDLSRVVVVGASLAGHRAVQSLRRAGYAGYLTVIGEERHSPYDRFPLSKRFLDRSLRRDQLDLAPAAHEAIWRLSSRAVGLDAVGREVVLDSGERLPYDGLVVATGARARDADRVDRVSGAFVMRTVDDAEALRRHLKTQHRHVLVVGGGLIGAEVAATVNAGGHRTVLIDPGEVPTSRALGHPVAEHLLDLHRAAGLTVLTGERAEDLVISDGAVRGVRLRDGNVWRADTVVLATGTTPNVEWLEGSGLDFAAGLRCTATLHASGAVADERIVGAGDVALVPQSLLAGLPLRLESWASTLAQADVAAKSLLQGRVDSQGCPTLPTYATTIHGLRARVVGYPQVADTTRLLWGSLRDGQALFVLGRCGQAVGVVSVNVHEALPDLARQLLPRAGTGDIVLRSAPDSH